MPRLFATYDALGSRHTATTLETAYAGAAALAEQGLEFVVAPLQSGTGRFTVPVGTGALSVTRWLAAPRAGADRVDGLDPVGQATLLGRLHAAVPPRLAPWRPLVDEEWGARLRDRLAGPWSEGPHGEPVRRRLEEAYPSISTRARRYLRLVERALATRDDWVATHGEPHARNQLLGPRGPLVVDWETLRLAPRERDLRPMVAGGHAALVGPDPELLELFDLEWHLDEVDGYAGWFAGPHGDDEDDRTARAGLWAELDR